MSSTLITILVTIFASSGFWTLMLAIYTAKHDKSSNETKMLLGLAHDRIFELCEQILKRGEMTQGEYDNLLHLYKPYKSLGGNGTAEKLMKEVEEMHLTMEEKP